MAHIIDFSIVGLAGRKGTYAHTLNRDVNVFFGLNGSGKTSLLRILNSAMSNDTSLLANVPFKSATVTIHSLEHKKDYTHSISVDDLAMTDDAQRHLFELGPPTLMKYTRRQLTEMQRRIVWQVEPEVADQHAWSHRFLPATRLLHLSRRMRDDPITSEEGFDLHFERTLQEHWSAFFGEIQAGVRKSQQDALADILNAVLNVEELTEQESALDSGIAYHQMSSFLQRQNPRAPVPAKRSFRKRFDASPLLRNVVSRIDGVEREIEEAMKPRTQLDCLVDRLFSGNKKLTFGSTSIHVVADDKTDIGLRSLSSGEKHILRILLETIQTEKSTLLVDEPEMSLHLDWQRGLISAMRELNTDAQLILATHSPEVMAEIDESKIFSL